MTQADLSAYDLALCHLFNPGIRDKKSWLKSENFTVHAKTWVGSNMPGGVILGYDFDLGGSD